MVLYIISKIDEYKHGYLDINTSVIYALIFVITIIIFSSFKLMGAKTTYARFYISRVEFYDSKNKIENIINFKILDDKILLCNSRNIVGQKYENHIKNNGKFIFVSFFNTIIGGFGLLFLGMFIVLMRRIF